MSLVFTFEAAAGSVGITIVSRSAEEVAPEAIVFEVDVSELSGFTASAPTGGDVYDARLHDIEYFWDFYYSGTDNSYLFAAPVNLYDGNDAWTNGYRNSRYAFGFQAAHVYREPGTYTVRLTAYEPQSGTVAYATQEVTIADPDTLFSGTNTIFLSPSGDFTDAPSGARQLTSGDVDAAYEAWVDGQEATPKRIMLNRGETYTNFNIGMGIGSVDTPTTHIVAGPGAGAKPTVNSQSSDVVIFYDQATAGGIDKDVVVQNIIFNGTWDSTTMTDTNAENTSPALLNTYASEALGPYSALFDGVEAYNFAKAVEDPGTTAALVFNDCVIEGFGYGGAVFKNETFVTLGCRVMSDVNALVDATINQGWGWRIGSDTNSIIWACDMFIRQDNFPTFPRNGQPCLRFNSSGVEGVKINCHANCLEAQYSQVDLRGSESANVNYTVNGLFRNNYLIGAYNTVMGFRFEQTGFSASNNIMVAAQIADETNGRDNELGSMLSLSNDGNNSAGNLGEVARFYQNTLVNRATSDGQTNDMNIASVAGTFTAEVIQNNIIHQPSISTPETPYAPLGDDANTYFTPRHLGYRDSSVDDRTDTASVTTAGHFDLYDPETGSSAIGAASTGLVSWRDFRGVIRTDIATSQGRSQSAGAIEPDLAS